MTKKAIAGRAAAPTATAKKETPTENARVDAADDSVLVDQFTREFQAVVRQVKEIHAGTASLAGDAGATGNSSFNADGDAQSEKRQVAHYGVVGQRLHALVRRLLFRTDELAPPKKELLLVTFGDKFAALHEFHAAETHCYAQVTAGWLRAEPQQGEGTRRPKNDVYVRAVYGQAMCQFHVLRRGDPFVRFPGTLEKMVVALGLLQHGMEAAAELERESPHQYAWLLLNGSVLVYSIARPLQELGFEREVVAYLKWCLLCLESTVMLSTTKYIRWRLQIYVAVCGCLETMATKRPQKAAAHLQSALACAEHAVQAVARLRKEEELDLPLPKPVATTLRQAEAIAAMLAVQFRTIAKGEFFGRKAIETSSSVTDTVDRFCLAMDALERCGASRPADNAGVDEILTFALEIAQPILQATVDATQSESSDGGGDPAAWRQLDSAVPIAFHVTLLRYASRLRRTADASLLLTSLRSRLDTLNEVATFRAELDVYAAELDMDKPASTEGEGIMLDPVLQRWRLVSAAQALGRFVRHTSEFVGGTMRDHLCQLALRLWAEGGAVVVRELDASSKPGEEGFDLLQVEQGVTLLEAIYAALRMVQFEDPIQLGEICLRLCLLLQVREDRRRAVRTLRDYLLLVDAFRDRVVDTSNHFGPVADTKKQAASLASFSFDIPAKYGQSDCLSSDLTAPASSRGSVGVQGTGSQLGGMWQELICIQVDATLLLFQLELEEAAAVDAIEIDLGSKQHAQQLPMRHISILTTVETSLHKAFKRNAYARVLLNIQRMRRPGVTQEAAAEMASECIKFLQQAEVQERELAKSIIADDNISAAPLEETSAPHPPRILIRSSRSIVVEIQPFKPSSTAARRRRVVFYMVFAKPSGAGTDVSLNNTDFPGTGEPVYPPATRVTVSGLSPNTSYVFAVAAFDEAGEIILSIGETSRPVVAVNPLPLAACYGYLAQASYELKLMPHARKAALQVYECVVSKEFAERPGWSANFFYRHALKRDVVARWPIPLLNLVVQSIVVICDAEEGDPFRDGQLTSEGMMLRNQQIAVLEASKMIAIGLELASATADHEQIRALSFKGYRVLLPLLHLDDVDALTFAALATYYQALRCIPLADWDTDTRSMAARIAFELMRIAWHHRHLTDGVYSQVAKIKDLSRVGNLADTSDSNEMQAALDCVAIAECILGYPLGSNAVESRPTTATAGAPQLTGAKPSAPPPVNSAKTLAAPPQATARRPEESEALPSLSDLLAQSKLSLRDAFKSLEPFMRTNRDSFEAFCKLCQCAVDTGDETAVNEWLPLVKFGGKIGTKCKATITCAGLGIIIPELAPPPVATPSAPNTARSTVKTPRTSDPAASGLLPDTPRPNPADEPEFGADDEYLYTWCGEICLLQARSLLRKLSHRAALDEDVDCLRGPLFNHSFGVLHGDASHGGSSLPDVKSARAGDRDGANEENERSPKEEVAQPTSSRECSETTHALFGQFMSRIAASCRLFAQARAWQALQTAAQHAANSIWLAWVSPETVVQATQGKCLEDLVSCVDSILDMIESVTELLKAERSGKVVTTLSPTDHGFNRPTAFTNDALSMASTTVVVSAMSSLNADQTWISNLLEFTTQALLAAKMWHKLVQTGKKYHLLSGGGSRFSEKMFHLLVYAQHRYLAEQNELLSSAESTLASFIKAFNDAEAKKKKKKSRLVVEEVLTPEEIEFRGKKTEMEKEIHELTQERNARQQELDSLQKTHHVLSRTTNKCTQALDTCHELVETYRRHGEASVQPHQVVSSFSHCVALSRQKRQRRLAGKALQELGDFLWARGDTMAAVKSWNEAVDNAFNALRATSCWRDIIEFTWEDEASANDPLIEGDGLWTCLESCIAVVKLILFDLQPSTSAVDLARMIAAVFTRIATKCSLPNPSRPYLYGTHQILSQLWPWQELLIDTERLDAPRVGMMFLVAVEVLLRYERPTEAMPLIAAYEILSLQCSEDVNHFANARRLRVDALAQCGRFHDAFEMIASLLTSVVTGCDAKPKVAVALMDKLQFRDDRPIEDTANSAVLSWLAAIDVSKMYGELLVLRYSPETARFVLVSILKVVGLLAQREPIEDEMASTARQIGDKMATSLAALLTQHLQQFVAAEQPGAQASDNDLVATVPTAARWESLSIRHIHAEVLLQQCMLSCSGGQWSSAQELCTRVVQAAAELRLALGDAQKTLDVRILSMDTHMPSALVYKATSLVVRARLISVKSAISLGRYQYAIQQAGVAVDEARRWGEDEHFVRQIELLRVQAYMFVGSVDDATYELTKLRDAFTASHSAGNPSFVEVLRISASILRGQAMESENATPKLQQSLSFLEQAEAALDCVLRRDGWIGVDTNLHTDKRWNLYHPSIPVFVQLKAEVVQALMETPPSSPSDAGVRRKRALLSIEVALKAAGHSVTPLATIKARLLLQKGAILKKMLVDAQKSNTLSSTDTFDHCVQALIASAEEAMQVESGGHDREGIRLAMLELVDIYGQKLISGEESAHLHAAFHYLNLGVAVRSLQRTLFDSLELQNATLVNGDKLPTFLTHAITEQSKPSSTVAAPPPVVNTGKGGGPPAASEANKRSMVDAQRLVNYFVKILREKHVLPAGIGFQHDVVVFIHAFLVQNHSSYVKFCCLQAVPPVPRDDPEIKAGLVCADWMRDLTPALTSTCEPSAEGTVSLFFTLGTTRIDGGGGGLLKDNEGFSQRVEMFATSPLLSRRTGVRERDIARIRHEISRLRIEMEDEGSIVLDRSAFALKLYSALVDIQHLFRNSSAPDTKQFIDTGFGEPSQSSDEVGGTESDSPTIRDSFGVSIPVACTLDTVKLLEGLLCTDHGVNNVIDNAICYFLRDLLDS